MCLGLGVELRYAHYSSRCAAGAGASAALPSLSAARAREEGNGSEMINKEEIDVVYMQEHSHSECGLAGF